MAYSRFFNKIIEENFPKLSKDTLIWIQEAQRTPNRQDQKNKSPWHIIVETLCIHNKDSTLKASREKPQVTYKGNTIRITAQLSLESLKGRRV